MVRPYIIPKYVLSEVQTEWDDKNIRQTAPSVLVKILHNIMCLQIKEKVLLYTQNCVTIGTININNLYDPTYTTKFSGAYWNKEKLVFPVQLTT